MKLESSDLVARFVEDCREHLDNIESALIDIETAGDDLNPELVNSVFRLAHSIKGGAGMLGLGNIKSLAHKLENVLHMVRSRKLSPTREVVETLLKGFDRLTALVDNIADSENMPIASWVDRLLAVSQSGAGDAAKVVAPARFEVGATAIFEVDPVSLEQAKSGGNELYLLEFDLIHDIHGKGRMPFEVLRMLTDTGRIVDCKVDLAAVGDLDAFGNNIPFYVLFATLLEPKYLRSLVKLPEERVRHIGDVPNAVTAVPLRDIEESFGTLVLRRDGDDGTLVLPDEISEAVLENLRGALLAGLERCATLTLDWRQVCSADIFFYQLLLSARRSYANRSKALHVVGPMPTDLRTSCLIQGLGDPEQPGCLLPER